MYQLHPTSGADVGYCVLEVYPRYVVGPRQWEWEGDDEPPTAPFLVIGDTSYEGEVTGDVVTFTLPDLTANIGQRFVIVDRDTDDVPLVAGDIIEWGGGSAIPARLTVVRGSDGGVVVRTGARGLQGIQGEQGPIAADGGPLAERPDAEDVPHGYVWGGSDQGGGQLDQNLDGVWTQMAPSMDQRAMPPLATVWPASVAGVAHPGSGVSSVLELTSAAFTWPDREVRMLVAQSAVIASTAITTGWFWLCQFRIGAGSWTTFWAIQSPQSAGTAISTQAEIAHIPASITGPSPGDSVQMRLAIQSSDARTYTPFVGGFPFYRWAGFDVVVAGSAV